MHDHDDLYSKFALSNFGSSSQNHFISCSVFLYLTFQIVFFHFKPDNVSFIVKFISFKLLNHLYLIIVVL